MDEQIQPIDEQLGETSEVAFRDPFGDDPVAIPDPMPDELITDPGEDTPTVFEGMEGDAPTS